MEPKEIAQKWYDLLEVDYERLLSALELIKEKNVLGPHDVNQLNQCGVPIMGALTDYLGLDSVQITFQRVQDDSINYDMVCEVLELKYNKMKEKQPTDKHATRLLVFGADKNLPKSTDPHNRTQFN